MDTTNIVVTAICCAALVGLTVYCCWQNLRDKRREREKAR